MKIASTELLDIAEAIEQLIVSYFQSEEHDFYTELADEYWNTPGDRCGTLHNFENVLVLKVFAEKIRADSQLANDSVAGTRHSGRAAAASPGKGKKRQ